MRVTVTVDTIVCGGTIVNENGRMRAGLAIDAGKIVAIAHEALLPAARETIDATGKFVLPGIIDVHVHFRDPGMTEKEDWATGSAAAAVGGVTTVFDMPNTIPPVDNVENFERKKAEAEAKSIVDFGIYGLLAEHNLEQLAGMAEAGICGYKLFLGNTTGDLPCPSDGAVLQGFEILAELGLRCSIHAENSPILFWRQNQMKAAGRDDHLAHLAARTDVVAIEALNRAAVFADWTGARIHIVHESCAGSIPYIKFHKARGVDMTVETLPQYLYLNAEMGIGRLGDLMRMNPPIRQQSHQALLWEALIEGTIDMIATDHAPHTDAQQMNDSVWNVACGFAGVETCVPLMLDAVSKGRMSMENYVRMSSGAPARAFGLYGRKGVLRVGADADLVLVDLGRKEAISTERLHSRGKATPFEGYEVTGVPVLTMVRGAVVARDGQPIGKPGWGRIVRPEMPAPRPRNSNTTSKAILQPNQVPW
jgi:dihydroorotase